MITKLFELRLPTSPLHLINYGRRSPLPAIIKINKIGDHWVMALPKVQIELVAGMPGLDLQHGLPISSCLGYYHPWDE